MSFDSAPIAGALRLNEVENLFKSLVNLLDTPLRSPNLLNVFVRQSVSHVADYFNQLGLSLTPFFDQLAPLRC